MHSIVIPSSSGLLTISFIASPTPCCPFLASQLKKTRYPDATIWEVPSLFVSCSPMTSQPFAAQVFSRVLMGPIPSTPLTAAVRTLNVPNASSSSRYLALAVLCFLPTDLFPLRPMPSAFHSISRVFYLGSCLRSSHVLGAALSPRLDSPIVDTFADSRVPFAHTSSPRFGSHVFRGGGAPTLLPQARLPRETVSLSWSASPPVDAVGRLALSASTSSRINQSMS